LFAGGFGCPTDELPCLAVYTGETAGRPAAMFTLAVLEYIADVRLVSENAQHELQHRPCHDR